MATQYSKDEQFKFEKSTSSLYRLVKVENSGEQWIHVWSGVASSLGQAIKKYNEQY